VQNEIKIHDQEYTYINTYTYVYINIHIYDIHIHINVYKYMYTHTYIHICNDPPNTSLIILSSIGEVERVVLVFVDLELDILSS
jgi:hypothetical protein